MATIEDVAKAAGVSRQTVSRIINRSGYAGEKTRERVEQAIKDLNYRPNLLAKALVTKKQRTIAYVMVNISDPFHNLVKQGFESSAYHRSYTSIMCDVHSAKRQQDYIRSFQGNMTGGVVFHHLAVTEKEISELNSAGIPCVLIDNEFDIAGVPSVNTDNYAGAGIAVKHLYEKGHRKIGCVHGVLQPYGSDGTAPYEDTFQFRIWQQRTAGFTDTAREYGLDADMLFQSNGRAELAGICAKRITNRILAMDDPPTALYCENDIMALAVLKQLQERGVSVPGEIALIGHDGLDMVKLLHPQLTTVEQPRYEMGRIAAEMLIDIIENKSGARHVTLEPVLSAGETT